MNKSILFVSQSFYPSVGGVSTLLLNLSKYLCESGFKVHAIHFEIPDNNVTSEAASYEITQHTINKSDLSNKDLQGYAMFKEVIYRHLHGLDEFRFGGIEAIPGYFEYLKCSELFSEKLRSVISKEPIDIVHFQDYQVLGSISVLPSQIRSIFSLHAPLLQSINPKVSNWLMRYLDKVNALVFSVPEYSNTAFSLGVPMSRIATIPPIIDTSVMETVQSESVTLNRFLEIGKIVTCVQRFDSKSGQLQLIESFSKISKKHSDAYLVLVGGGSFTDTISNIRRNYYQDAVELVNKLGLKKRVIFLGNVDYLYLSQVYRSSDIVVMLSKMECFGLAISEAMYENKPIIVTDVGGLAYQVRDGYNGYKVKPRDIDSTSRYLDLLLSSTRKRELMGRNSRVFFDKFLNPRLILPKYLDLYISVLSNRMHAVNYEYLYNQLR